MSFAQWLRPPHHVLAVFLCIMLVFGCALGWLGWQLLAQERSFESQRVQERLERAADHMGSNEVKPVIRSVNTGEERELIPSPAFASSAYPGLLQWFPDSRSILMSDWGRVTWSSAG